LQDGAPLTHHWLLIFILRSFIISTLDFGYIPKYRLRPYYFLGGILHKPNVQSAFSSLREHSTEQFRETDSQAAAINIPHSKYLGWRLSVARPMEEEEEEEEAKSLPKLRMMRYLTLWRS
jgi:hypothetical protein